MYLKRLPEYLETIGYARPSKIIPLVGMSLLITLTELFSIVIIFPIIQAFLDFDAFAAGRVSRVLAAFLHLQDPSDVAIFLVGVLAATIVTKGILSFFGYRWIFRVISRDEAEFSARQYARLLCRDFLFFQATESSKIIRDIAIAIPLGFSTVLQALLILVSETFVFSGIALYLLVLNPVFFGVVLVILFAAAIVYGKIIGPVLARLGRERHEVMHKTIGTISQSIEGIGQIKNWQAENYFSGLFGSQRLEQARIVAAQMVMQYMPKLYFESIVMMVICCALLYFLASGTAVTAFLPLLGFYVVAAFRSLPSVLRISAQYNVLVSSSTGFETVLSFGKEALSQTKEKSAFERPLFRNSFEVKDVFFSYSRQPVINGLTLRLERGEMIGISGRSGEGKTTLVNIMAGLLPIKGANILIDGRPLSDDGRHILLEAVGYVSQNTFLLNGTIRENVAFGVNSDAIDDAKVWEALRFAQIDAFANAQPEGIFHKVGERGGRISGGQRQRLGIARAFYFDRDILILDEATASLDEETESSFIDVLKSLKGKKTVIVISHKPSPLSVCDKVYEMKSGSLSLQSPSKEIESG
ncbi:MAG TPA: hypothetical protein DEA55_03200 [Rhodospirillaceae bacterium]|nr:hypothetical protein [Rhodospirillaceae bacterium]